jgi:hypothetical protein
MSKKYEVLVDGEVVNTVLADLQWLQDNIPNATFREVVLDAEPKLNYRLTKREFRERFTQEEKLSMYDLATRAGTMDVSDPYRTMALSMAIYLDDLISQDYVDLDFKQTIDSVNALEAFGLIGTGRAAEILQGA